MDQIKIGKFIAARRKEAGLTQAQLAERLGITDRAVSKWETGRSLPDAALMPDLCAALGIGIQDLFCGEVVSMHDCSEQLKNELLDMTRQKQEADRHLLRLEIFIGVMSTAILFALVFTAALADLVTWVRVALIAAGFVLFIPGIALALKIEQTAGYYACAVCGHRHIPTYRAVISAPHMNRTRQMRCPVCGKKSWQKKVLTRE